MSTAPSAIKMILMTEDSILAYHTAKGFAFPVFLSKGREFPQESARRVLRSIYGLSDASFVALPIITRIYAEELPEEERLNWPKGVRTVPVVGFASQVGANQPTLPSGAVWLPKAGAHTLLSNKEDKELILQL